MSKWVVDPDHSVAAFSVRHMMVADVHGQFNKITGTVEFDPLDAARISVAIEISAESIFTGIKKRDDHLRSQDFFDVEKYPGITFKSKKAERTGFSSLKITGDLTMHGITRSVTLDVSYSGPVKSPFGETCLGFAGRLRVDREEFAMIWNQQLDLGGMMVGKDIDILINLETDMVP